MRGCSYEEMLKAKGVLKSLLLSVLSLEYVFIWSPMHVHAARCHSAHPEARDERECPSGTVYHP